MWPLLVELTFNVCFYKRRQIIHCFTKFAWEQLFLVLSFTHYLEQTDICSVSPGKVIKSIIILKYLWLHLLVKDKFIYLTILKFVSGNSNRIMTDSLTPWEIHHCGNVLMCERDVVRWEIWNGREVSQLVHRHSPSLPCRLTLFSVKTMVNLSYSEAKHLSLGSTFRRSR